MSFQELMVAVADRVGRPANSKDGAFDRIIDYWLEGGGYAIAMP